MSMKIRAKPFKLTVTPTKGGFICEFSGTDADGRNIEIELEFPRWWIHEIMRKMELFTRENPKK